MVCFKIYDDALTQMLMKYRTINGLTLLEYTEYGEYSYLVSIFRNRSVLRAYVHAGNGKPGEHKSLTV